MPVKEKQHLLNHQTVFLLKVNIHTKRHRALISACSTPQVIDATKLSDRNLSCESLKDEFQQAQKAKKDAEDVKGVTGTNTMAALFWLPGIIATYSNANEAIAAADTRMVRLTDLMDKKNCK
jgi:hypothetical protein